MATGVYVPFLGHKNLHFSNCPHFPHLHVINSTSTPHFSTSSSFTSTFFSTSSCIFLSPHSPRPLSHLSTSTFFYPHVSPPHLPSCVFRVSWSNWTTMRDVWTSCRVRCAPSTMPYQTCRRRWTGWSHGESVFKPGDSSAIFSCLKDCDDYVAKPKTNI